MIHIQRGTKVRYDGKEYEVLNLIDLDKVLIADSEQNIKTVKISELDQLHPVKEASEAGSLEMIDAKDLEAAQKRFAMIRPLLRADRGKKDVQAVSEKYGVSMVTLYKWIRLFENSGTVLSLLPKYKNRGGKGKPRVDPRVQHIMDAVIEDKYLSKQKRTIRKVYEELMIILKREGLPVPAYNTLRDRIKKLDTALVAKRREGRSAFMNSFQPSPDKYEAKYPLDIIQIDHTPLDIQVVDEIHRKVIGRPYITVAIDIYSRMIYGFCLTLDNPGYYSVGQTIFMGLAPKERYLEKIGVEGEWKIYGLPKGLTFHTDNAAEFRGDDLRRFCETLGINMEFRPRGSPHYGGHVERVIKTLNMQLHALPGSTFSNVQDRGEYKSEKEAAFTLGELERWIADYIVNVYHQKIHSSLDMSPQQKYTQGILGDGERPGMGLPPMLSADEMEFARLSLLPAEYRTVQKDGITIFGIKYYSDVLRSYIKSEVLIPHDGLKKGKYLVKYDPKDMSKIYFYAPDHRQYFEIPYRNMMLPSVTLWDIMNARKYLKEKHVRGIDDVKIFEAIKRLKRLESEAVEKSKKSRRKSESRRSKTNFEKVAAKEETKEEEGGFDIDIGDDDGFEIDF